MEEELLNVIIIGVAIIFSIAVGIPLGLRSVKKSNQKAAIVKEKERVAAEKQARIDQDYLDSIVKTVIVDSSHIVTNNGVSTGSAVGRAVVGGAIFGDVGAVVGASTAKNKVTEKHSTTFLVYFTDGTQRAITVDNGSKQYNMYISKLSQ